MENLLANSCLHIQQIQSNISVHLELCVCPPGKCKSNINSLLALFWSPPTPEEISVSLTVLHYVYCLVASFMCLSFGAEQVVVFPLKTAACCG